MESDRSMANEGLLANWMSRDLQVGRTSEDEAEMEMLYEEEEDELRIPKNLIYLSATY